MKLDFSKREKITGLFLITVMMLLLLSVVFIGRGKDWFRSSTEYYTVFDESYNLKTGASVKLYNAEIGKVKKISPVENRVRIKLKIYTEFSTRIRSDSIASVESPTFIGSEYISIKSGSAEKLMIPEGGKIKSIEKKSLTDVLEEFQVEKTAKMVIQAIQDISEITTTLRDPEGPLFEAINSLNSSMKTVDENLEEILANVAATTGKVPGTIDLANDNLAQIKAMTKELSRSIELLEEVMINVKEGSVDVPAVTGTTRKGIEEIRTGVKKIDDVVESLQKNVLIRSNLPVSPEPEMMDSGLRK